MKLILSTEWAAELKMQLPTDIQTVWVDSDGDFASDPRGAEAFLSWFYVKSDTLHKVLAAAPTLRWQHTPSAGVNNILTPDFLGRNLVLTNGAGVFAEPIAEFVFAFILNHAKQLSKLQALQAEHSWGQDWYCRQNGGPRDLEEATLLIIGAGGIGQAIAQRASAFSMRVWGCRRNPQPLSGFDRMVGPQGWRTLLPEAEYVVLAAPLTAETIGMIDDAALRSMRSNAYLINIARGALVDQVALLTALQEGWIAGAGLDALWTEPLPPESPFWSLPNVFVTPHCSGFSPKNNQRSIALFLDNLNRFRSGMPLRNVVDQIAGY